MRTNIGSDDSVSVSALVRHAWSIFKRKPLLLIGTNFAFIAIGYVIGFILGLISSVFNSFNMPVAGSLLTAAVSMLLQIMTTMWGMSFAIKAHDSIETLRFKDAWDTRLFWPFAGTLVLWSIVMIIGFILLFVPGVIASIVFLFSMYAVLDKRIMPVAALKDSFRISKGNWLRILLISFVCTALICAGFLALIIGALVALPLSQLIMVTAYKRLSKRADGQLKPLPLTNTEKGLLVASIIFTFLLAGFFLFLLPKFFGNQGLSVKPGDNPVSSIAPSNAIRLPFTGIRLHNSSTLPIEIKGIEVSVEPKSDPQGITAVELIDENGIQLGNSASIDSKGKALVGSVFRLLPGDTTNLVIAANMGECAKNCPNTPQSITVAVNGIRTDAGVSAAFPIVGATHMMHSPLKVGTALLTTPDEQAAKNLNPNTDQSFANFRIINGTQEDMLLDSLRFKYSGNLDFKYISNVQVTIAERNYPLLWSDDLKYVYVKFPQGVFIAEKGELEVNLHTSIAAKSPAYATVQFDIEKPSDVYLVGQIYGYGVAPTRVGESQNRSWVKGTEFIVTK